MTTPSEQTRNESYQSEQPTIGKRAVVLEWVRARGKDGATREAIAAGTGFRLSSVCGRVNELEAAGLLVATGERRRGVSGKALSVVVAQEFASGAKESARRESSVDQAIAGDSPSDPRRAARDEGQGDRSQIRSEAVDGAKHSLATQLAAFAAKRDTTVQQLNLFQ